MYPLDHWESVYTTKSDAELSWFQTAPTLSLQITQSLTPKPTSVIDIGGGQSTLAGELLDMCVPDVTVLDLSSAALERAKHRLGVRAARIRWMTADILDNPDLGQVDLWHDRAALHFLTDPAQRATYFAKLRQTLRPGGTAIIAGFAPDGPTRCSNLDVHRTGAASLAAELGHGFRLLREDTETHTTPWGAQQRFAYATLIAS